MICKVPYTFNAAWTWVEIAMVPEFQYLLGRIYYISWTHPER